MFQIHGHRGCRGLMPENTIPAFLKAMQLGVDVLELDVVISKDHQVVVSHEPYFHPAFSLTPLGEPVGENQKGNIYEQTYKEIRKYDVGIAGNRQYPQQEKISAYKPLLSEVLVYCEAYALKHGHKPFSYNIEIKSTEDLYGTYQPKADVFSDLVHQEIFKILPPKRVILQSFDFKVLQYWKDKIQKGIYKKAALSVLIEPFENNDFQAVLDSLGFEPDIWSPYFLHLNKEKVAILHKRNIQTIPWTVNDPDAMRQMKMINCDGIITDFPDRAMSLFNPQD